MRILGKFLSLFTTMLYKNKYIHFRQRITEEYDAFLDSKIILPNFLIEYLIYAEDRRFFSHNGVDFIAISHAFLNNVTGHSIRGASTIEQQLVRVITEDYSRTYKRKIKEIFLAVKVFHLIPKINVPVLYLYKAYYGSDMLGISNACNKLNYDMKNLTYRQAAELVALIKYPLKRNVSNHRLRQIESRAMKILEHFDKSQSR